MKLIIGLGNIGDKYQKTRHNAGFVSVDSLQQNWKLAAFSDDKKFFGEVAHGSVDGQAVILLKPSTMMNLSGKSVLAVMQFYKLTAADILLIYDDKDLPLGQLRWRDGGGHGGHNGVRDIQRALNTQQIARLKIGVDNPARSEHEIDTATFVLANFTASEQAELSKLLPEITERAAKWIQA